MRLGDKFLAACVSVLIGVLALNWAVQLLTGIWPQLAIGAGVVLLVLGAGTLLRWRRNRW